MITDFQGKKYLKVNLHMHTSLSDGHISPEEAVKRYKAENYDAIALTDHWVQGKPYEQDGVVILAGCEFHAGSDPIRDGVYHIVGIGMEKEVIPSDRTNVQSIIDAIHDAGGIAILAHPAWSMDTPEMLFRLRDVDAVEIYNTVSDFKVNYRADSSDTIDQLAVLGRYLPLVASDDVHYYEGDECKSFIYVDAEAPTREAILKAIREEKFYASQGPELYAEVKDGVVSVDCTPASKIIFHTGTVWHADAVKRGENLTHAEFRLHGGEHFLRVSVTDADGKRAWSNFLIKE